MSALEMSARRRARRGARRGRARPGWRRARSRRAALPPRRESGSADPGQPVGDHAADLAPGVLLDEVRPGGGHLGLVGPGSAELALRADEDRPGLDVEEQLRDARRRRQPLGVVVADLDDVGRRAHQRQLARPPRRRQTGAAPGTAPGWRRAQSKPSALPQSWRTSVTSSRTPTASKNASRKSRWQAKV